MRSKAQESSLYLLLFFLSIGIIFLDSKLLLNPIKSQVQNVLNPIFATLEKTDSVGSGLFSEEIKSKDLKIKQLEEENASLQAKIAQSKNLEEENLSARRLLGAQVPPSWKFEPARKLRSLGDELFLISEIVPTPRTFVITTQDPDAKSGVYIGYTKDVIGQLTQVILPTHTESKLSAFVRNPDSFEQKSSGILEGRGGRVLLTQVLASEDITEGDIITITGSEDQTLGLQTELLLGKISKVISIENSAFKQAEVELTLNPKEVDYAFYLTKK